MTRFKFTHDWQAAGNDAPEYRHTMARLALHIGNVSLMKSEDIWSRTIRDSVLVSAYPLALWLASAWWRLNWEPRPFGPPPLDWRMAHELGAANHGYVWPKVVFESDGETMQVWAAASDMNNEQQSVRYLNGLDAPAVIELADFQRGVEDFITAVLHRLDALDCQDTDLANLWQLIQEERADPQSSNYRRMEAEMGYDPDECPDDIMDKAMALKQRMGGAALSELAPVYGKPDAHKPLAAIEEIADGPGLFGAPAVPDCPGDFPSTAVPWQRAAAAARALRQALGNPHNTITNNDLYGLLGLKTADVEQWSPARRNHVALAIPGTQDHFKFIPRKKHPLGKRFELARLLGDYIFTSKAEPRWLATTDLHTSRQKYQRAFAAEFLCPVAALQDFLQGDYSEPAIEDAAQHFEVSRQAVEPLLINNGLIPAPFYASSRLPYSLNA